MSYAKATSVRLSPTTVRKAGRLAKKLKTTRSEILRMALDRGLTILERRVKQ